MKREADIIKKNKKSANEYLTQTRRNCHFIVTGKCGIIFLVITIFRHDYRRDSCGKRK